MLDTNAVISFTFKEAEGSETGVISNRINNPMSKETTAWLEGLQVILVPLPVVFELDVLNRLDKKEDRLMFMNKGGKPIEGHDLLRFLIDEGGLTMFERMTARDAAAITDLRAKESVESGVEKEYFDVALPYMASEYGYRVITCDPFLQAKPELKTGW